MGKWRALLEPGVSFHQSGAAKSLQGDFHKYRFSRSLKRAHQLNTLCTHTPSGRKTRFLFCSGSAVTWFEYWESLSGNTPESWKHNHASGFKTWWHLAFSCLMPAEKCLSYFGCFSMSPIMSHYIENKIIAKFQWRTCQRWEKNKLPWEVCWAEIKLSDYVIAGFCLSSGS